MPIWIQAGLWGLLAGGALVVGALVAWFVHVPRAVVASVMAFGAGVLISALAFDLVAEAEATGGLRRRWSASWAARWSTWWPTSRSPGAGRVTASVPRTSSPPSASSRAAERRSPSAPSWTACRSRSCSGSPS